MSNRSPSEAPLRLVVRADASRTIGLGHVARCLALAAAVSEAGGCTHFVTRDADHIARERISTAGHELTLLPDGLGAEGDAAATCTAARAGDVVLVDHYGLGPSWWARVRREAPLAAVDDEGRPELAGAVDLVLNQNAGAEAIEYPNVPVVLAGPRYVLLGPAFRARREHRYACRRRIREGHPVRRVLVTLGGADPKDATSLVLAGLSATPGEFAVDVVVGPGFVHGDRVRRVAANDRRVELHESLASLAPLIEFADLAVSASGSTSYELAYFGVPTVLVEVAPNQRCVGTALDRSGAACFLGRVEDLDSAAIGSVATRILGAAAVRESLAEMAAACVDGDGVARVATALRTVRDLCGGVRE